MGRGSSGKGIMIIEHLAQYLTSTQIYEVEVKYVTSQKIHILARNYNDFKFFHEQVCLV